MATRTRRPLPASVVQAHKTSDTLDNIGACARLVSNRDDHLRNHGFLRTRSGWRLAPAYDLNPSPDKHEHALTLDEASAEPRIDTVLETAEYYRLTSPEARRVVSQVRSVVSGWKAKAQSVGLSRAELQRMESAFAPNDAG